MLLPLVLACTPDPAGHPTAPADTPAETVGTAPGWVACDDAPPVVLNEALASNAQGEADDLGSQSDWLEVALAEGGDAVSLEGWALSKDGDPAWTFPAITLAPGETKLVWASGADRADPAAPLHASFSLDTLGDALFLHMPDGCVADRVDLPRLYADQSYGRAADDGAWEYFLAPTPGAPNTTESRPGFAPKPTITPDGGFYAGAVEIAGEGTLRYTLDGSVPEEDAAEVDGPLTVGDTAVAVRAVAFQDGLWPSRVATATYMPDPGLGIAVVSLVVDPPDLWDEDRGIYVYGSTPYEDWYPYFGSNFWELWERDLHVEIWEPDGTRVVSQDAGIQIAGGYSRAFDQRNFELLARTGYGPETFDAALFPDEEIDEYHRLYLRNGGDWCGTQIVDGTVQALLRDEDGRRLDAFDAQAYRPALVWLNGEFWGLYELKERLDEWFVADHHDEDPDDLDRVKLGWTHDANWEFEEGDWEAFDALETLTTTRDLGDADAWAEFESRVDVTNFAAQIVAEGWIANSDWWGNNIRMWRPHDDDGRWRWMVYDFGHGWPSPTSEHLSTTVATSAKGMRVADALENDAFRVALANAHAELLNTTMAPDNAVATVERLAAEVAPAMPLQRARWCGGADTSAFDAAVAGAERFAAERPAKMDADVIRYLAPGGHAALSLDADPQGAGRFRMSVVEVGAPFTGTFYKDTPVTVTAEAQQGWVFDGWSDPDLGDAATVTLPMSGDTSVTARFVRE